MAFWTESSIEPKRNFRFQVQLGDDVIWWAKNITTPSFDVATVEHNYLDNKYFFPGRVTWQDVSLTLVDPISIDAVKKTNEYVIGKDISSLNYKVKQKTDLETTVSKAKATEALGQVVITILDAGGDAVETWTLNNAFILSAKYGDLAYDNDELRTIDMTFKYDWASCETADGTGQFVTTTSS